jgi:DNA polymerase III subunit delta
MKANAREITKALDAPSATTRLYFLYGPDESGSRALAQRLVRAMGADAEKVELDSAQLKGDPARLADEAASFSLFGGKRFIIVTLAGSGDDAMPAIDALLQAEVTGNPVVVVGGGIKGTAGIVKKLLAEPAALCFASYQPSSSDLEDIATAMAREEGLRLQPEAARRVVRLSGGDRAVMGKEIEKLALYLDAAPDRPTEAGPEALDAIGADSGETEMAGFTAAVLDGNPAAAAALTARLAAEGTDGIGLLRVLSKRVQTLIPLQARVAQGESLEAVTKAIFFKDQAPTMRQLRLWPAAKLATAAERLLEAERAIKRSGAAGTILADAETIAISRAAQRGR